MSKPEKTGGEHRKQTGKTGGEHRKQTGKNRGEHRKHAPQFLSDNCDFSLYPLK